MHRRPAFLVLSVQKVRRSVTTCFLEHEHHLNPPKHLKTLNPTYSILESESPLAVAAGSGDVEEGAAVLVAEGEVGRGEGGERRGIAGLRGVEDLLLQ